MLNSNGGRHSHDMSDRFKKLLEVKAPHQKLAAWRKPDRFTLFLGKGLMVSSGILTLGFFFIVFTRALGLGEVFGDSLQQL